MRKIGIIGAGFSGTMTAVHLIHNTSDPIEIILINEKKTMHKGIAFEPYSKQHLLNVTTIKMSAFADDKEHFLNWVMMHDNYSSKDRNIIADSFLPRYIYGQYLDDIWLEATSSAKAKQVKITHKDGLVTDLDVSAEDATLYINNGEKLTVDACIITSGNNAPGNPRIPNQKFYESPNYYQNPWGKASVINTVANKPILIVGNGLTMVDTVLGLRENGFENEIYSISPNGFNILPHRHNGFVYTKLIDELKDDATFLDIVKLFNKHIKLIREFGLSAEPVVDSLRPLTQEIWKRLTQREKKIFISRFRNLWGVARHRIPLHIYDKLQKQRIDDKLNIRAGKLLNITEENGDVNVEFYNKKTQRNENLIVQRVINCTGPETNLEMLNENFLSKCQKKGIVVQDEFKLGINADSNTYQVLDKYGNQIKNLFTIGSSLRGMLWESTAVNELRYQADRLARVILSLYQTQSEEKVTVIV